MVTVPCAHCGKLVYRFPYALLRGRRTYCSRECKDSFRRENSRTCVVFCQHCGKPCGRKSPGRLLDRPRSFCDHVCYGKWRTAKLSGEASPAWKFGYMQAYGKELQSKKWRKIAADIRRRDKHRCTDCKKKWKKGSRAFDVHHIDRGKEPCGKNLRTVCRQCHRKYH